MPSTRRGRLLLLLALAVAVLAGCSGGEEARGTVNVPMYDNFFARDVTRVPADQGPLPPTSGAPHNAVAVDGSWRTPERVGADQAATVVLDQLGRVPLLLQLPRHPGRRQGMAATLVVGDVSYYLGQEAAGPALRPVARASGVTRRVP